MRAYVREPHLELALVHEHHRPVRPTLAVAESKLLVKATGGDVVLARTEVDVVGALLAGELDRRLHQRQAEAAPPVGGRDVELGQVALEALAPDRGPKPKHRQTIRAA